MQPKGKCCLSLPHILRSQMEAEHLSDWSKVTHGAGDQQDARLADFQSCVLSLHLAKQKRPSHEGEQVKQAPNMELA